MEAMDQQIHQDNPIESDVPDHYEHPAARTKFKVRPSTVTAAWIRQALKSIGPAIGVAPAFRRRAGSALKEGGHKFRLTQALPPPPTQPFFYFRLDKRRY